MDISDLKYIWRSVIESLKFTNAICTVKHGEGGINMSIIVLPNGTGALH